MSKMHAAIYAVLIFFLYIGASQAQQATLKPPSLASIASATSAETTFVSVTGKQAPVLFNLQGSADTAGNYTFRDGIAGTTIFTIWLPARSTNIPPIDFPIFPPARTALANNTLTVQGPTDSNANFNVTFGVVPR